MNIGENYYCSRCMRKMEQENICPHCGYDHGESISGSQIEEGTLLHNGRYELGTVIGQGGFGITYSAWDQVLEIPVAIKEYFPRHYCQRDPSESDVVSILPDCGSFYYLGLKTFIREARILAVLQNIPTVVKVYDCFEKNNTAYLVMEFVRGETLWDYCRKHNPSEKQLLKMLRSTMDDLIRVHSAGVLHRDISPTNLMVQEDGTVKLMDFGAAADLHRADEINASLNRSFAAPEQYEARGAQGYWTDVYGLAATLYALFSGKNIDDAPTRMERDSLRSLRKEGIRVSRRVSRAIYRGLQLAPKKRTPDMEEFRAELYHLPLPIRTKRQKSIYTLKIIALVCILEASMLGIDHCLEINLPRQIQLSAQALRNHDQDMGYTLATNYQKGYLGNEHFKRNSELSRFWYVWAAQHGSIPAAVDYGYELVWGHTFAQDIPKAMEYFAQAARADDPVALYNLGILYLDGTYIPRNTEMGMEYLSKAAELGYVQAMRCLGDIYRTGNGCTADMPMAAKYYRMAADHQDPLGLLALGGCSLYGLGVPQDTAGFLKYAYRSAYLGCGEAMFQLGEFFRLGEFQEPDYMEAMFWYEAAIEQFYDGGYYGAAILYRDGLGVPADPEKAAAYFAYAEEAGFYEESEETP